MKARAGGHRTRDVTPGRRPTMADIAQLAEVDISVVSRVLSNDPKLSVREETRQRVLDVVNASGYVPNPIAQSLRTARAGVFGLLIPDFGNPVYATIIQGAEIEAASRGCLLMTGSLADPALTLDDYLARLTKGRVDGLIVAGIENAAAALRQLRDLDVPWLLLNRRAPGAGRYVISDDEKASSLAVEHLVALGHRRIAHISGPMTLDTAERRRDGFIKALTATGLSCPDDWMPAGDYTAHGGAVAMSALLRRRRHPTAVFAANLMTAIGAIAAARNGGLSVPEDVSVVGIDDLPLVEFLSPSITTVRMPHHEMGRAAVRLLATTSATSPVREVIRDPMELLVRESTAPPRRD